ncbi:MAG: ChaN family lipoprotein [Planctomycetota bacterium]|nr:ChaN family lipoprotein [Planctomycetota bacterium]
MRRRDCSEHGPSPGDLRAASAALAGLLIMTGCRSAGAVAGSLPGASAIGLSPRHLRLDAESLEATGARGQARLVMTPEQRSVRLEDAVADLASADVVFLGELHDNTEGHAVQLALTRGLADARGSLILSMEMLERDVQRRLDLYLDGVLTEEEFLSGTRQWGNYAQHYRGAVELARERGFHVVAGNVYRPIASRVARRGLAAGAGDPWAARSVDVSDGEYKRRFLDVMSGGHGGVGGPEPDAAFLERVFAAQCIKDDTMAESIALAMADAGEPVPIVVHWNGRFHSDYGLGTVERLRRRVPGLNIAVVSMIETEDLDRELVGDEVDQGHYVIMVPPEADGG